MILDQKKVLWVPEPALKDPAILYKIDGSQLSPTAAVLKGAHTKKGAAQIGQPLFVKDLEDMGRRLVIYCNRE